MMITQYYPNPLFRKSGAKHRQSGNGTITYEAGNEHRFLSPLFFHYQKSGEATTSTLERELKSLLWSRL